MDNAVVAIAIGDEDIARQTHCYAGRHIQVGFILARFIGYTERQQ